MSQNFTKFAFTESVKSAQERYGTRRSYARMETAGDRYRLIETEADFIQSRDSFYMATVQDRPTRYRAASEPRRADARHVSHRRSALRLGPPDHLGRRSKGARS